MEIYLTRMELNTGLRRVWNDLSNPQQLHRTISSAFPQIEGQADLPHNERRTPRNQFHLLHRLEFDRDAGKATLLVQSSMLPDWGSLGVGYADRIESKPLHDKYSKIENGMHLIFRLQANPTKRVGKADEFADARFRDPEARRRVDIRSEEGRVAWLKRKGDECGFQITSIKVKEDVLNLTSAQQGPIKFRRERGTPAITLGSVIFEGVLRVNNAEVFRLALVKGIGPGKAYGFGLMSVAPVREG